MTAPAVVGAGVAAGLVATALAWARMSGDTRGLLLRRLGVAAAAAIATGAPYVLRVTVALVRS
jgi:hypothetical protein